MENFEPQKYRDSLAKEIRQESDVKKRKEILKSAKLTPEYQGAKKIKQENIIRMFGESQILYLERAGGLVTKKLRKQLGLGLLFDSGRVKESEIPQDILSMIDGVVSEALKPRDSVVDLEKNEKIIERISEVLEYHNRGEFVSSNDFDKTQRNRKFFETGTASAKRETYWNTLFFPYNTKSTRRLAKQILDNKKIVLLGGGRSRIKEELLKNEIYPREVVNVDPFVENVEESADPVIPMSATDANFDKVMRDYGLDYADEIWAEYSVPAYLDNVDEIKQLMQNIDQILVPGGVARIWPIMVGGSGDRSDHIARRDALVEVIRDINNLNGYEISIYKSAGRHGLTLQKISLPKDELKKQEDAEKTEIIRNNLKKLNN